MGLAHLEWLGAGDDGQRFVLDIGSNHFFRVAVGGEATSRRYGIEQLDEPGHVSELAGPLPASRRGRELITVPADAFDRERHHVQVISYRTQDMRSPALSNIVAVPRFGRSVGPGAGSRESGDLPALTFGLVQGGTPRSSDGARYRSRSAARSEALFVDTLIAAIPNLLGGLLAGRRTQGAGTGSTRVATGDDALATIGRIVEQVLAAIGRAAPTGAAADTPVAPLPPAAATASSMEYSQAMIAPALAALIPLLQSVLTPETIKTLLQTVDPSRLLGTTIEGIKAIGRLGLDSAEQDNRHIRELHPGNDDPLLQALLTSMSLSFSQESPARGSHRVAVHIDDGVTHLVGGRPRALFSMRHDLRPVISVDTPRPIGRAILDLRLKHRDSLEVLHHTRARLYDLGAGAITDGPAIGADVLSGLAPGEYLLCVTLRWRSAAGDVLAADRRQLITLMGDAVFDHLESGGEIVPLNDIVAHRDFWHEVWTRELTEQRHRLRISVRYAISVVAGNAGPGRGSTDVAHRAADRVTRLKVRSGATYTIAQLARLLPQFGHPSLSIEQLAALNDADLLDDLSGEAHGSGRISGRPGRTASLWVYPEVRLQSIVLLRPADIAPTGQVLAVEPEAVVVPVPALIHLIGTRSE